MKKRLPVTGNWPDNDKAALRFSLASSQLASNPV